MSLWQCSNCLKTYTFEEIMNLENVWVDKKNREYGKSMVCICGKKFMEDKWHILSTEPQTGYTVSTVHLELSHPSNLDTNSEEIMWYETMVIDKNNDFMDFQARYGTREKAIEGHELTLKLLPKIIENPEKYPQDIISKFLNKVKE